MVVSFLKGAADAVVSAGSAVGTKVSDTARGTRDAGIATKDAVVGFGQAVVDTGIAVKDTATETAAVVREQTEAVIDFAKFTVGTTAIVGATVVGVVAPVPALFGALIIEIMLAIIASKADRISSGLDAKKIARKNARLVEKLSKYGKIPATALIETDTASLRLDTTAGTISGQIKTGIFAGRNIGDMTVAELGEFASIADAETAKLIEAYIKFRNSHSGS